jgi:cell division protease FtsH
MKNRNRFTIGYLIAAILVLLVVRPLLDHEDRVELPFSEFRTRLQQKRIKDVVVSEHEIRGTFVRAEQGKQRFVTRRVASDLAKELEQHGVRYAGEHEDTVLAGLLSWLLPAGVMIAIWMVLMRRVAQAGPGAGLMAIGKSKAKVYVETQTGVGFADVAGVDEAKAELQEVVAFLKDPRGYGRLGARMPKGVLLVGPPGTGKTLLARAVAGEAGVPFLSISGSEFVEMFVGVGAARVRDLFEDARSKAPCIIFIDELDALGRARLAGPMMGSHDEKEQTLNQLLVELDGFDPSSGIVLLAATNRPEILDPALLRAGRFDRQVLVDRPDRKGRVDILRVHIRKVTLEPHVDLERVAAMTPGFTGADLANLVNEAALAATRRSARAVSLADFNAAIERIVAGLEKRNRLLNPVERRIVAYHEMGHALVASAITGSDPVHKISIIPRGIGALGYTIQRPIEDRYLMTQRELENKLVMLLGGRGAESLVFDELSTGAADDLVKATEIARSMAMQYGMVKKLGHVSYVHRRQAAMMPGWFEPQRVYSEATATQIDDAVQRLVEHAFERALGLLGRHRDLLERGAAQLLEKETLEEAELAQLFAELKRPEQAAAENAAASGELRTMPPANRAAS